MNKRKIGKINEDKARVYLENNGYKIIELNYTTKFGEIDIIAKDLKDDYFCFIEVKFRKKLDFGLGVEAVNLKKQKKIISVAKAYVVNKNLNPNDKYRFDVISIDGDDIKLYKGAFS